MNVSLRCSLLSSMADSLQGLGKSFFSQLDKKVYLTAGLCFAALALLFVFIYRSFRAKQLQDKMDDKGVKGASINPSNVGQAVKPPSAEAGKGDSTVNQQDQVSGTKAPINQAGFGQAPNNVGQAVKPPLVDAGKGNSIVNPQSQIGGTQAPIKPNNVGQAVNQPPAAMDAQAVEQIRSIFEDVYFRKNTVGSTDFQAIKEALWNIKSVIHQCKEVSIYRGFKTIDYHFNNIEADFKAIEKGQINLCNHLNHLSKFKEILNVYATSALEEGNNQHQLVNVKVVEDLEAQITYKEWYDSFLTPFFSKIENRKNRIIEQVKAAGLEKYLPAEK